jgi:phosphate transport system ATP-binding protein
MVVRDVNLNIFPQQITALIGASGCGKSTVLRCFNRLNDSIAHFRLTGTVYYHHYDLYARSIDPVAVRRQIGMVFQKPNPFPKSIYNNVAYGRRIAGNCADLDEAVERSLHQAALWDEVKDKLHTPALALSCGQQQRLCIARTIAVQPDVVLMDEPCASLDPIATGEIEALIRALATTYTIVIVTHNLQQARRLADVTAFFHTQVDERGDRFGYLAEMGQTEALFSNPQTVAMKTYLEG